MKGSFWRSSMNRKENPHKIQFSSIETAEAYGFHIKRKIRGKLSEILPLLEEVSAMVKFTK